MSVYASTVELMGDQPARLVIGKEGDRIGRIYIGDRDETTNCSAFTFFPLGRYSAWLYLSPRSVDSHGEVQEYEVHGEYTIHAANP